MRELRRFAVFEDVDQSAFAERLWQNGNPSRDVQSLHCQLLQRWSNGGLTVGAFWYLFAR